MSIVSSETKIAFPYQHQAITLEATAGAVVPISAVFASEGPFLEHPADVAAHLAAAIAEVIEDQDFPEKLRVTASCVMRNLCSLGPRVTPELLQDGKDILVHLRASTEAAVIVVGEPEQPYLPVSGEADKKQRLRDSLAGANERGDENDARVLEAALRALEPIPA